MLLSVLINTILEFLAVILVFYFILGTDFLITPARILLSLIMFTTQIIMQAVSIKVFNTSLINTFSILAITIIIFNGTFLYKTCWLSVLSLAGIIAAYPVSNIFYIYSGSLIDSTSATGFLRLTDRIILLIFIICAIALHKSRLQRQKAIKQIERKSCFLMLFSCIITKVLLGMSELLFYRNINQFSQYIIAYLIFLLIVVLMVTVFAFLKTQYQHNLLKEKEELQRKYIRMEQLYYSQLEQKNNDLRAFRHDFNSHILVLQDLAYKGQTEELKKYLEEISTIHKQSFYISTGNLIADVIINHFFNKLENGVLFKTSGYFKEDCFASSFDICTILSNLLNNACEALERKDTPCPKEIYLDIDSSGGRISILIKNTSGNIIKNKSGSIQTAKPDKDNHGIGLENIQTTAEKYHGFIKTSYKNNMFCTYVVLNKPL
ncbi:MAG: GHKL domain-containing protein [Lachnospiraceae bacterium]|nr:GHKL domain-containing protein [Lachnospiraceae bacterium]